MYLEEASARGLNIERVTDTHVHADFLRGHLELAAQTSAVISFGEGPGTEFPIETLHDGPRLSPGEVTPEILDASSQMLRVARMEREAAAQADAMVLPVATPSLSSASIWQPGPAALVWTVEMTVGSTFRAGRSHQKALLGTYGAPSAMTPA